MLFKPLIYILFLTTVLVSSAESSVVINEDTKEQPSFNIGPILETYEAALEETTVEAVRNKPFKTLGKDTPNFGYTNNPVWGRFSIENNLEEQVHRFLSYGRSRVDYLTLYIVKDDEIIRTVETGRMFPFGTRDIKHRNFVFNLHIEAKSKITIYFKVLSESHIKFPVQVVTFIKFFRDDHESQIALGIYYGAMLIMIIYNLIIYFAVKDTAYLYYVASIFTTHVVGKMSLNGMDYEYLWPNSPSWNKLFLPFILSLSVYFIVKLFQKFRDAEKSYALVDKFATGFKVAALLGLFLPFFLKNMTASIIIQIMTAASVAYFLIGGSYMVFYRNDRVAKYFLYAWSFFLVGYLIRFLMAVDTLESSFISTYSLHIGAILQVTLLSLGLAYRIKNLKEQKHLAEKANEMKSMFLANISHDIRTPLHGILSHAQFGLTRIDKIGRDKILRYFTNIKESGERLLHLLNDLLDLSKLESGKINYTMTFNRASSILARTITEFSSQIEEKQIKLEYESAEFDYDVYGDAMRLRQVFSNIVSNSLKFSNNEGTIKLSSIDKGHCYIVSVDDSGSGIPEDELDNIFEVFVQSKSEVTEKRGTGLGLSICRKIIEDHGGQIWAENSSLGGASIRIKLPKKNDNQVSSGSSKSSK